MKKHIILLTIFLTIANFSPIFGMEMNIDDIDNIDTIRGSIQTRISQGENLNKPDVLGIIPLIFAAQHNDFTLFFKLIGLQVNVNVQDKQGLTPLSWAILKGNKDFAHRLIDKGARGDIQDMNGDTALTLAYGFSYILIVKHLIADEYNLSLTPSEEKKEKEPEKVEKVTTKNKLARAARSGMNMAKLGIKEGFKAAKHPMRYTKRAVSHPKKVMIETQKRILDEIVKKELQEKAAGKKRAQIGKEWSSLMMAVFNNDLETFVALINDPKVDVNARDVAGYTILAKAVGYGHIEIVKALINHKNIAIDLWILGRVTPLMIAISSKHFEIVKLLLEKGANINATTKEGTVPLITALCYSTKEIVDLLLNDEELDVNFQDKWGKSALFYVIENYVSILDKNAPENVNILNIVKKLVELGADVNVKDYRNYGLLFSAAKKGALMIVEYLVSQGAIIEDETVITSPLHANKKKTIDNEVENFLDREVENFLRAKLKEIEQLAQEEMPTLEFSDEDSYHEDAELKISDEEELEKKDDDVFTAGDQSNQQLEVLDGALAVDVQPILEEQASAPVENQQPNENNIHLKKFVIALINGNFKTAHDVLCKENIDLERAIKFLLTKTNSIDTRYKDSSTLLMHAITFKNFEFVKLLLDYGANPNATNNDKITPLMYAANFGCLEIIDYLISKGALINACDRYNKTPLVYAIEKYNDLAAKFLIVNGADINDVSCAATFMIAARTEDLQLLKIFLDLGINQNACNKGGTALINAIKAKSIPAIVLLLKYWADVNVSDGKMSPLQYAFIDFDPDIVKLLIEQGADLNVPYKIGNKMTILEYLNNAKKKPIEVNGKKYFVKELNNRHILFTDQKPWNFKDMFNTKISDNDSQNYSNLKSNTAPVLPVIDEQKDKSTFAQKKESITNSQNKIIEIEPLFVGLFSEHTRSVSSLGIQNSLSGLPPVSEQISQSISAQQVQSNHEKLNNEINIVLDSLQHRKK